MFIDTSAYTGALDMTTSNPATDDMVVDTSGTDMVVDSNTDTSVAKNPNVNEYEQERIIIGKASLIQRHYDHLKTSGISDEIIGERGYTSVFSYKNWEDLKAGKLASGQHKFPGIAFPNYGLGQETNTVWVLRPDNPRKPKGSDRSIKYEWPTGVPTNIDMLPRFFELLRDPTIPIIITEGTKKGDSIATHFTGKHLAVPLALNGVWGWITKDKKFDGKLINSEIYQINLENRKVRLAFDSDVVAKPSVRKALSDLAGILHGRRAVIEYYALPDKGDGKAGIDDLLAVDMTPAELDAYLQPWIGTIKRQPTKITMFDGKSMDLPAGYSLDNGVLSKVSDGGLGEVRRDIYHGNIAPIGTAEDLATKEQHLTVAFTNARGVRPNKVTAPHFELATKAGVIKYLAAAGASIHETNAREVAAYLIETTGLNVDTLPHTCHSSKLGLVDDSIVLPDRTVCRDADKPPIAYAGHVPAHPAGSDRLYVDMLRRILVEHWNVPSLWLMLAFSLASPIIARMRPMRNPVLYVSGPSGGGKTTGVKFCLGAWAAPNGAPFVVQATARTTAAGYYQNLVHLNGLPVLFDEAHQGKPEVLQAVGYGFANSESYAKGGRDGTPAGSEKLRGTLVLAGEARLEWQNAGSTNRVLWIDHGKYPFLGAGPESALGAKRAQMLENAYLNGAGVLGPMVAEYIWPRWDEFKGDVAQLRKEIIEDDDSMSKISAWTETLAIAQQTLNYMFDMLNFDMPEVSELLNELPSQALAMLTEGRKEQDPVEMAWEKLQTLLTYGELETRNGWVSRVYQQQTIAQRHEIGENAWRVPTNTKAFDEIVGKSAVQMYGQKWLEQGRVQRNSKDGSATFTCRVNGALVKALYVPIDTSSDEDDLG